MDRVLLVEPDRQLAPAIEKYLRNGGLEMDIAHNAQEAVSLADKNKPAVVVLELAMPKNNGIAFLQEFRSYTDWIDVPVIIYSRIPREDSGLSAAEWQKQGVVEYLYKPTATLASLLNNIQSNLNKYDIS